MLLYCVLLIWCVDIVLLSDVKPWTDPAQYLSCTHSYSTYIIIPDLSTTLIYFKYIQTPTNQCLGGSQFNDAPIILSEKQSNTHIVLYLKKPPMGAPLTVHTSWSTVNIVFYSVHLPHQQDSIFETKFHWSISPIFRNDVMALIRCLATALLAMGSSSSGQMFDLSVQG